MIPLNNWFLYMAIRIIVNITNNQIVFILIWGFVMIIIRIKITFNYILKNI